MIIRTLPILAKLLIFIGVFPFLSLGLASAILFLTGCAGITGDNCTLFGIGFDKVVLTMFFVFSWVVYTIPVGIAGIILLMVSWRHSPNKE